MMLHRVPSASVSASIDGRAQARLSVPPSPLLGCPGSFHQSYENTAKGVLLISGADPSPPDCGLTAFPWRNTHHQSSVTLKFGGGGEANSDFFHLGPIDTFAKCEPVFSALTSTRRILMITGVTSLVGAVTSSTSEQGLKQ